MTHPQTSQLGAKEQGVSIRVVIIPHAAKRSGGSRPVKHLPRTALSLALVKPIKRELQQEVGILELEELEDSAGGVVSDRLMQSATINPDLSSCHLSAALGKSGRRTSSTCGGCREAQSLAALDECRLLTGFPSLRQFPLGGCVWQ